MSNKNDWYERGELPPVGTQCEVNHIGEWKPTVIVGYDAGLPVFKTEWNDRYAYACGDDFEFRPIRTERDVLVEKAFNDIGRLSNDDDTYIIERLIAKGWRPVKQQGEDEFASYAKEIRFGILSTDEWLDLYRAGFRFIEQGE